MHGGEILSVCVQVYITLCGSNLRSPTLWGPANILNYIFWKM